MVPGVLNAAMLRFDITATDNTFVGDVGMFSGSHFIIDTDVENTSTDPSNALYSSSIVGGHVDSMDPINGPVSADISADDGGSITATSDGTNTTWSIPVGGDAYTDQSSTLMIEFGGEELSQNMSDDEELYNDTYLGGYIDAAGANIDFDEFTVSEISGSTTTDPAAPAPIPLPAPFFLMASALGMMLWRQSKLSLSQFKKLLTS
jgi:hypothetical protein